VGKLQRQHTLLCSTERDAETSLLPDHNSHSQTPSSQVLSFDAAEKKQMQLSPKPAHSRNCSPPSGMCPVFDSSVSNTDTNRAGSMLENTILLDLSVSSFKTFP